MSTAVPALASPTVIDARHALCRGGYAAIVFCGRRDVLGELAGEPTAHTQWKFVLDDPTLAADDDFARSSGATLPQWPEEDVRPLDGVCFVFTNADHPAIEKFVAAGAQYAEHFVLAGGINGQQDDRLFERITAFLGEVPSRGRITVLGYGHQGRCIVEILRTRLGVAAQRILVHDSNAGSRVSAVRDGLCITADDSDVFSESVAVIASPLSRHEPITALVDRARVQGLPVFDNAQTRSSLRQWTQQSEKIWMDEPAHRALKVFGGGCRMTCKDQTLRTLLVASIVREDDRVLNGVQLPHLQCGQMRAVAAAPEFDLAQRWPGDGLANETYFGLRRAFVSMRNRADSGFFAARELCLDLWPIATRAIFPSEHAIDLGATAFERLLKGHLDGREIVSTMQTPAQRVTLGAAAAHYATSQPIVEIGSAFGGSALLMAAATDQHRPHIISIDPDAPTRDIMRFAFDREGHGDRLQQIVKISDDAIADLAHVRGKCGLVFIDGLHTADAVLHDFRNYAPLVAIGGALAFHDVCPTIHAVLQAVVERVLIDDRFAAKCLVDGLLVLERVG